MSRVSREFLDSVREAAGPRVWSKGVELARQGTITARDDGRELRVTVLDRIGAPARTVVLIPDDGDWTCNCGSDDDPCAHIAAAVIAVQKAGREGLGLPAAPTTMHDVEYAFVTDGRNLRLERWLRSGNGRAPLAAPLTALVSGRVQGPLVAAGPADLAVDVLLQEHRDPLPSPAVLARILELLRSSERVTLDGVAVPIARHELRPVLEVRDDGAWVRLIVGDPQGSLKTWQNGAVLTETGLAVLKIPALSPPERQLLMRDRRYAVQEVPWLASDVLPALEERFHIRLTSARVPRRVQAEPRLWFETEGTGSILRVIPAIVYGDPPVARLQGDRLLALGQALPARDQTKELKLKDQLGREFGLELDVAREYPAGEAVRLVSRLRAGGHGVSKGADRFVVRSTLQPAFREERGGLSLGFFPVGLPDDLPAGTGEERSPAAIGFDRCWQAWKEGERLLDLGEAGFAAIPQQWMQEFGEKFAQLFAGRNGKPVPASALLSAAAWLPNQGMELPQDLQALRQRAVAKLAAVGPDTWQEASVLRAELRSYQKIGVSWLRAHRDLGFGALLADDMGLGKTVQTCAVLQGRCLVVAPASVVYNWQSELQKFRPDLCVRLYHGPGRTLSSDPGVTVTTYAVLRLDIEQLRQIRFDVIVLDEAHAIKNPQSQTSRAAHSLQGAFRIALTGTPVENRPEDLWSQMEFLNPGLLGGLEFFRQHYGRAAAGDESLTQALRDRINPFILRRRLRDVMQDLPVRTDVMHLIDLSEPERALYQGLRQAAMLEVAGGADEPGFLKLLTALTRMRQACCHPGLLPGLSETSSAKLNALGEILEGLREGQHKVLVFSQWTSLLDLIEPLLADLNLGFVRLDGSTSDRAAVVGTFQSEDGPPVMLISLKAGGVGLNLTAADHVIIMDPWWNPAAEEQAAARAHRIGQTQPVFVHRLVARDTIEEKILKLQAGKRQLAAALSGEETLRETVSTEDLLALLD